MTFALSYSFASTFLNCPRSAYHKFVARDLPKETTPAMAEGIRVHDAFAKRLTEGVPLPADMRQYDSLCTRLRMRCIHVEQPVGMTVGGKGTGFWADPWARGKADVVIIDQGKALILDWKTGRKREDPLELEILSTLIRANNSDIKSFKGAYVWLKEGKMGAMHDLDPERGRRTLDNVWNAAHEQGEGEWTPTPNPLCGYCTVHTCEHNKVRE